MAKAKLTLYVDQETSVRAHKTARLRGKSISALVKEYFLEKEKEFRSREIAHSVSKWIGILDTQKTYKALRDEQVESRLKRREDIC